MMNKIPSLEISLQTIQFPLQIFTSDAVITNEFLLIGVNHCWFEQRKTFAYFSNFFFSLHPHFFFSSFTTLQNFLLVLFGSVASELVCEADLSADYM